MANTATADIVLRSKLAEVLHRIGGMPSGSFAGPGGVSPDWREHIIEVDLTGYRHSAIQFDFASLISDGGPFVNTTSAGDAGFRDGFRLIDPIRRGPRSGLTRGGERRRVYSSALFNLADFDGQTVLLSIGFDHGAATRQGIIDIDDLAIEARVAPEPPSAAAIPEPETATLMSAAFLVLAFSLRGRRKVWNPLSQ